MKNVYFISGLGADERAFQYLDLSFCNPVFVHWIKPLPKETFHHYAARLREQIKDEAPVIVGLSFGGMTAIEIARQFPVKKLILLSSAKAENEIPFYLHYLRYLPLHKIVSASFLRSANHFAYRLMGIAKREDKVLFTSMLKDADDDFLKWAIHQIAHWNNKTFPKHTHHIHGTGDIMLPFRYIQADDTIQGGKHLMVMTKAKAVSDLLRKLVETC